MNNFLLATAAVLSLAACTPLYAKTALSGGAYHPDAGQPVLTGRGQAVSTGRTDNNMQATTLPGGGQGLLTNNGNGTSTLIGPGSITTLPTPR